MTKKPGSTERKESASQRSSIKLKGGLKLDNVSFRYRDDGPLTLDRVTIEARP